MRGETKKAAVSTIRTAQIGRVKKMLKLPREINRDWRSDVSMIGPSTIARMKGAPSNPTRRKRKPTMPKTSMMIISATLVFKL